MSLSLSSLLFLTGIVGCTPADNHGTDGETTDRVSSVRISAGSSASEQYAARELQAYLEKMSITVEENGEFPMTIQTDASLGIVG